MTTTSEVATQPRTQKALGGVIAKVAEKYGEEGEDFGRILIATIFPKGRNAPTPTKSHVAALCVVAHEYGLNPLLRQVYAFPDKQGGIVPVISVDGWYAIANRHPQFDGIEFEHHEDENGRPLSCTATVYRKDRSHPVRVTEWVSECKRETEPWRKQSHRMIQHRAAIQGIRVAFGIAAVDPEDAERMPSYEVYPAQAGQTEDPVAKINREAKEAQARKRRTAVPEAEEPAEAAPEPEPAEEPEARKPRTRTPKGRAIKIQREEFDRLLDNGTVDESLISPELPEEPEALEDAFASMSKEDAAALLVRCRAGEFTHAKSTEAEKPSDEGEPAAEARSEAEPTPGGDGSESGQHDAFDV